VTIVLFSYVKYSFILLFNFMLLYGNMFRNGFNTINSLVLVQISESLVIIN
jgi:hypothetical protein